MENWTLEKESLDIFARHYKTGEKIPRDLTDKIKASSLYMAGYMSLRQVTFSLLDMKYHTTPATQVGDPLEFEEKIVGPLRVMPKVNGVNSSCSFTHVFAGGYSAGYYSYKWAEVLDADAFELFQERGLFDPETARKFKENILSRGGTEHPMALYKKFRGREPDPDALLRRDGLI
jgi:peptidyl-dipeptidase Dcp